MDVIDSYRCVFFVCKHIDVLRTYGLSWICMEIYGQWWITLMGCNGILGNL